MKKLFDFIGYVAFEGLLLTGLFYVVKNLDQICTTGQQIVK